jgi:hypothetical protein
MSSVRWLTAICSTVIAFGLCLWLFRFVSFSWMPHAESDRWAVAAAFATVTAGAVGAATGWWAGRERERPDHPQTNVDPRDNPSGAQNVDDAKGQIFGPGGDFRGANFYYEPKLNPPLTPRTSSVNRPNQAASDQPEAIREESGGASIIPINRNADSRQEGYRQRRSWDDLSEALRQTSLDGKDWVALAGSSHRLRRELEAERAPDPSLPGSVPILVTRLRNLLKTLASSTSTPNFDVRVEEAQQTIDWLLGLLNSNSS